ncbi:hypothetical protein M422DRAFT_60910 [Sphaerobolus stellatus SS14]|uniref:PhoD-like phosphatase domain-containing protein n=1 Tax=Sphaerobolus stellatus (strain SS14) TaxID=990650 RepID=A0A0C9VJS3_SPHS4|nr:hypothetical protein M422DRAFT_60910 [Sphaerobolus stellatus SS14]
MDNAGWRAQKRAAHEDEQYGHPQRAPDGHYTGVERVQSLNEVYPPLLPPRPTFEINGEHWQQATDTKEHIYADVSTSSTPVERSRLQEQHAPVQMNPHLNVMCGPLLRYDTVTPSGVYRGACMIVTADAGSTYEPHPNMSFEWDPSAPRTSRRSASISTTMRAAGIGPMGVEVSGSLPHMLPDTLSAFNGHADSVRTQLTPFAQKIVIPGQDIWVYNGGEITCTFWRFIFEIPLTEVEMRIRYRLNHGPELDFFVPAFHQNMRWAAHSCNGFSAGVNPDDFKGPGFRSGNDPVWCDLLTKHAAEPFHVLVGGGDQLYCDAIMREPELQEWIHTKSQTVKKAYQMTAELHGAIDRFYFNHYCVTFRSGAFARANSIMLDDHDLIDGFGSYPADLQNSPMFSTIGSRGYFYYLLFQCFIVTSVDGVERRPHIHTFHSTVIGGPGAWIPYPSHSILTYLGPKVWLLMLDCRAERRKDQVCSSLEYQIVMDALYQLPSEVEHLVIQTGIPLAYPRMNFLETALESKFNPLVALGRNGSLGLSGMVNKFNADAELLDDLNDHWTAKGHKKERNWFIETVQQFAKVKRIRVSFLSGDVHCAAVGVLKTLVKGKEPGIAPAVDHRYMLNVVSSAIVNTPPPNGVLTMVSVLSDKKHKTMHYCDTDETMAPLFERDTNGSASKSKFIMGRRNWCKVDWDATTGELVFTIQVEKEKGIGETVAYPISAPPPQWQTA